MRRIGSLRSGIACVYEIRNTKTNRSYIGSTARFAIRFTEHNRMLNSGRHHSIKLQNSYNKHGATSFEMRVIEILPHSEFMIPREQWWLNKQGFRKTYNSVPMVESGGHIARTIFSICAKTGLVTKYNTPQEAAEEICGTRDKASQIHKAARNMTKSRGLYWTYDETETLSLFLTRKDIQSKIGKTKKVFAFDSNERIVGSFTSIAEASKSTGASASQIHQSMKAVAFRTAAGLTWSGTCEPRKITTKRIKPVAQKINGITVRIWDSLTDAAQSIDTATVKGISSAATGYTKSHRGYQWEFAKN